MPDCGLLSITSTSARILREASVNMFRIGPMAMLPRAWEIAALCNSSMRRLAASFFRRLQALLQIQFNRQVRNVSALGLGLSEFAVLEVFLHKVPQPADVIGKKSFAHQRLQHGSRRSPGIKKTGAEDCTHGDLRARIVQLTEPAA
jgi:hypothetical protein